MTDTIGEGDYVVLMKSFDSGNMKIAPACRNTVVHYGKLHFDSTPLIGCKYGSVFNISDGFMHKVEDFSVFCEQVSQDIATRSATLNAKSQFSREKTIKKKQKLVYSNVVTVVRPSLLLLNEMLYARDKLGGLRLDSLSQLITLADIHCGTRCLLMDQNLGIVTSAVMSRSLPDGLCVQLVADHESIYTTRNTLAMLNLGDDICGEKLLAITVRDLHKIRCSSTSSFSAEDKVLQAKNEHHIERLNNLVAQQELDSDNKKMDVDLDVSRKRELIEVLTKKEANRKARSLERIKARGLLKDQSMDSLILVGQSDHPLPLLRMTYEFLACSGQFVIYSDSIEPLLECHQYLKSRSLAVSLTLSESWLRKLQVLPDRTRPEMNVSGYGGYLLSGTKVVIERKDSP